MRDIRLQWTQEYRTDGPKVGDSVGIAIEVETGMIDGGYCLAVIVEAENHLATGARLVTQYTATAKEAD